MAENRFEKGILVCGDAFFLSPQQGLTASPAGCEMGRNPVIKRQLGDIFHDLSIEILPRG